MLNIDWENQNKIILPAFRKYTQSYIDDFIAAKDRVSALLGHKQNYAIGISREGILKDFLIKLLPRSVSIDSGYIYGYEKVETSNQLDIIIWDSCDHSPIYRSNSFVIVSPESVITVISVKSHFSRRDIQDSINNLMSVSNIELCFRDHAELIPITKYIFAYNSPGTMDRSLSTIASCYSDYYKNNEIIRNKINEIFSEIDPFKHDEKTSFAVERIYPKMMIIAKKKSISMITGFGPPEDLLAQKTYGPNLRRLPYIYPQSNIITSALEKFAFEIIQSVYRFRGIKEWSLTSAWIDCNPVNGFRSGDAWEPIEAKGLALLKF